MIAIYIVFPRPSNSELDQETLSRPVEAASTDVTHKPRPEPLPQDEATEPVPNGSNPQTSSTQDFLERVNNANTPEDVFKEPSTHFIANQVDGKWISQGDMLVGEKQLVKDVGTPQTRFIKIEKIDLWQNNTVPYRIDPTLDPTPILTAISHFHKHTNVRLVPHRNETDFVYFKAHQDQQCLSNLGRIGGVQEILLNPAFCGYAKIMHEIMHAIGFVHEHSREDRDEHVIIHWDQVKEAARHDFQKMAAHLSMLSEQPFDYDSIMLYSSDAYKVGSSPTITKLDGSRINAKRDTLSPGDIQKINALYPKAD